jgi:hypothetical protein
VAQDLILDMLAIPTHLVVQGSILDMLAILVHLVAPDLILAMLLGPALTWESLAAAEPCRRQVNLQLLLSWNK